jgi:hypothetical protein
VIAARPLPVVSTPALEIEFLNRLALRNGMACLAGMFDRGPGWDYPAPDWAILTVAALVAAGSVVRHQNNHDCLVITEAGLTRIGRRITGGRP